MGVMGNLAITRSVCRVWSDLVSTKGERAADRRLRPPHDDGGVVDPLRCGPQAVVRSVGQALSLDSSWVPSGWPVPMEVSRSKAVSSMGIDLCRTHGRAALFTAIYVRGIRAGFLACGRKYPSVRSWGSSSST